MNVSSDQPRPSLGKRILHEIKLVWLMTAYFAAGFCLLLIMQNALLAERGAEQIGYVSALVLAALLGKVVIVIDNMAFTQRFRHRTRIAHVIYSTVLFTVISHIVGFIEKVIKKMIHGDGFSDAFSHAFNDASLATFTAVTVALLILFGILFFVREVVALLGDGVLLKAMFSRPEPEDRH
jgi:hypothetical protein